MLQGNTSSPLIIAIDQLIIIVSGISAIYLTQERSAARRRWAPIIGLIGQPAWFWATIQAEQWGMFALSVLYTLVWIKGLWAQWFQAEPVVAGR